MNAIFRNGKAEITRRCFIKMGGAVVAGLAAGRSFAQDSVETPAAKGGPGYLCIDAAFSEGGYEPTMSGVAPPTEAILKEAIRELLR